MCMLKQCILWPKKVKCMHIVLTDGYDTVETRDMVLHNLLQFLMAKMVSN